MTIKVKVFPNARKPRIAEENGLIKVYVNAPAVDGKANAAVIKALSVHYKARKSAITIIKGRIAREKVISIDI